MEVYLLMRMVVVLCLIVLRAVLPAVAVKLRIRMDPALAVELKLA
jgi:hypothetical protein